MCVGGKEEMYNKKALTSVVIPIVSILVRYYYYTCKSYMNVLDSRCSVLTSSLVYDSILQPRARMIRETILFDLEFVSESFLNLS